MRLVIGDRRLTLEDLINVTRKGYKVEISEGAYKKVAEARELVDRYVKEKKVSYGITTGFGKFSDTVISEEQTKKSNNESFMWSGKSYFSGYGKGNNAFENSKFIKRTFRSKKNSFRYIGRYAE